MPDPQSLRQPARIAMSPGEAAAFLIDSVEGVIGRETVEGAARHRLRIATQLFVGGLKAG